MLYSLKSGCHFLWGSPDWTRGPSEVIAGEAFDCLTPGQSLTWHLRTGQFCFENEALDFWNGERYTYRYVGGEITWWDWGTKEIRNSVIGIWETC